MVDKVSSERCSEIMSSIRGADTGIELRFRRELWEKGIRGWRKNYKNLLGKPDIVFTKKKLAIFLDGCFWHGCFKCGQTPKSNSKYWEEKFRKNRERDKKNNLALKSLGWKVIRFWEHEINQHIHKCIAKVTKG